jgi:type III pantothenate kinase
MVNLVLYMNLVVDFGNTAIKMALFSGTELQEVKRFAHQQELVTYLTASPYRIQKAMIGSVTHAHAELETYFKNAGIVYLSYSSQLDLPLINRYETNESLGSDRIISCVAAKDLFADKNCLVIDAGTCIKYNFINAFGEFLGGSISAGMQMRYRALHEFTAKLPLLKADAAFEDLIGNSTYGSIVSGVQQAIVFEMEGFIDRYTDQFPDLAVVLCGGDASFFARRLKSSICVEPDLVLIGLNRILNAHFV